MRVAQGLPPDDPLDIDVWAMFCNPNKATLIHDLNDPIVPWISREEEALRNTVASALQEQVDIIVSVEPEIWDCMTTMKELIVGREVCKKKHGYHVEPETLDAIFDMQDAVSGGIDPAIADALGIVIDGVAGIPREVHDALDEMVGIVSRRQAREKMNANRIKTYLNRQVMVLASPTDESGFRGKCIRTYIKVTRVHPDPLPGTGLIYIDESTTVYGDEGASFLSEIAPGDTIMVQEPLDDDDSTSSSSDGENDDPGGYESRVVASVESDTVLRVYEAFSERVRSWDWIKAWGHQRTSIVLRTLEAEVVDVSYNEEEIDVAIPIERIHVLPSKEELEAKYLGKHVRLDGERGKIVAVYDDDTADVEYADEEMQNDYGVSIDELEFCGPPGETPRERKGSSAGKDGSDAEDGNEGTRPSTAAPAVGALDRDVPIVAGSSEEGRPKTAPSADPLRPLYVWGLDDDNGHQFDWAALLPPR